MANKEIIERTADFGPLTSDLSNYLPKFGLLTSEV